MDPASPRRFDPILVEVIKHELAAVAEEMAIAISRTGRSSQVRVGDFAAAVCDEEGRFFDAGYTFPLQLVGFEEVMKSVLARWRGQLDPGDVLVLNDPYSGMGHMPDTAVIAPIFWRDEVVGYTISYSHHTDVGGRFAGSFSSQPTSSFEEGLRLPPVKLVARGRRNEDLLAAILANVRTPDDWMGDIEAKIAGCGRGGDEFRRLLDKYGRQSLRDCCDYVMDVSEAAARAAISALADGRYEAERVLSDDGSGNPATLRFRLAMTVKGDGVAFDFAGTDRQVANAINCPFGHMKGVALGTAKTLVASRADMNSGFTRAFEVTAPKGTILNPVYPAAVGGRAPTTQTVIELVIDALSQAMPGQAPVMGEPGDLLHLSGRDAQGRPFTMMDSFFGGWGARPTKDGIDGVAMMQLGSTGLVPAEVIEREHPLVVVGFGFEPDTAGPGTHRGSVAVWRRWRFLEPAHAMLRTSRSSAPREGLMGGRAGSRSLTTLTRNGEARELPLQTHLHLELQAGDVMHHVIGGTAGYGDPFGRDPAAVRQDVREGKLTREAARTRYGVAIDAAGEVDQAATAALRSA
jgi:N-methylhydantoinase B